MARIDGGEMLIRVFEQQGIRNPLRVKRSAHLQDLLVTRVHRAYARAAT